MKNITCILLVLLLFCSCKDCKEGYNDKIRIRQYNGIIDTTFFEIAYRAETISFVGNNSNIIIGGYLGLFENSEKGDSIHKEIGSLAIYLYKTDTTMIFYPICDGDTLK